MLHRSADLRSVAFVTTWFVLVVVQWKDVITHPALVAATWLATAVFSFFAAVISHNSNHVTVFRSRVLEGVWRSALTLVYGHPVSSFKPGHNLSHHAHMETRRDVMRTSKARFRWHFLNGLLFASSLGPQLLGTELRYFRHAWVARPRWARQILVETAVFVLFIGALLWLDPFKLLVYVVLPWQYAAWGIVTMNLLQHDGCDPDHPWNHSRNFTGKLLNWWTFNNGFHSVHHMHPNLHWSELPAAHAARVHPHIHPALEQRSMLAYLLRTFLLPGGRIRYDGAPVVLRDEGPDEDWVLARTG